MHARPAVIQIDHLDFSWAGNPALKDLCLSIKAGDMFGLLGPNGSGKTTLICLLAGLLNAQAGRIDILGQDSIRHACEIRRQLGFVFQSLSLDRLMTVRQNLEFAGGLHGLSSQQVHLRIEELDSTLPLGDWLGKPLGSLSGGQKRLVDIARAMLHKPAILILDEPTTALDPASKQRVWATLKQLREQDKLTLWIATHLMDEAQDCDRVAFIQNGVKRWEGTPEEALDEMPNQDMQHIRKVNLSDWFIWKMGLKV